MSHTTHTEGPWRVGPTNPYDDEPDEIAIVTTALFGSDGHPLAVAVAIPAGGGGQRDIHPQITNANARLIASAPDLLAALKELCERFDTFGDKPYENPEDSPWFRARAAIATAEGE